MVGMSGLPLAIGEATGQVETLAQPRGVFDGGNGGPAAFKRWESQAARETFRSSGPDKEQRAAMLTVAVQEYTPTCGPGSENAQHELQHGPCHDR